MITLTDPTDDQLDEALAKAINWKPTVDGGIHWDHEQKPVVTYPRYTRDYNEVMPLLADYVTSIAIFRDKRATVVLMSADKNLNNTFSASAPTGPRAITIAILRALGVIVILNEVSTPPSSPTKTQSHA